MKRHYLPVIAALLLTGVSWCQDLPGLAAGILEQTDMARKAVAARDKGEARDHIRKASLLAGEIQKQSPADARPVMVPVYREIETTTTYRPVKRGKGEMTANRLKKNTSIREVQGEVASAQLNVTAAAERLPAAEAALERDDWATADTVLSDISKSVVTIQAEGDMPLLKARQNLMLARAHVVDGKYKDAAAPLRAAAEALATFDRGPNAEQAEKMRQQILDFAANIGHDHTHALGRIDSWLDPVNRWNE